MNVAAFSALGAIGVVDYVGPVDPGASIWHKAQSKLQRLTGSQGDYFFFSQQRLQAIAHQVSARRTAEAELDFFHGFTPWILTEPRRPYIAWSDCTFRDYINIFHRREEFRPADLDRIEHAEALWLKNASRVLFTSQWAMERAIAAYGLDSTRTGSVGIFGEVAEPDCDSYACGQEFVFVSTNFNAKGGPLVLAAFREVKHRHPEAELVIIGDQPVHGTNQPGVTGIGFLRKERADESARFQGILSRARALVNASQSDISPLVVIEAGYFGCPVISARQFAIPELVDDRVTGFLIDDFTRVEAMVQAMNWMLDHHAEYALMRQAAWAKARGQHSKRRFKQRLLSQVLNVMSATGISAA